MLTVYKASAGSGKTFQLVAAYLKLLLRNQYNYRQILAVTFTNKATTEMKSRILQQLHLLASNGKSAYEELLSDDLKLPGDVVRKRAQQVLKNILHDYSRFSVSTLDSFTQRVIKSFNREMGISPHFVLELNDDLVLEEAVDRLLAKIDTDKQLQKWLVEFSNEKIRENRSQQVESDIKSLGRELFREKFQLFFPEGKDSVYNRENLGKFRKDLQIIITGFGKKLQKMAMNSINLIDNNSFSTDDFLHKSAGVAGYLKVLTENIMKAPGVRVREAAESGEKWFLKTHPQNNLLKQLVDQNLRPALIEILLFYDKNVVLYFSAVEIIKRLRMLGILADLKEEIKLLLHEKGLVQLSDSNLLLNKIIGGSDSPFIYEKIGNRFNYYMLDEFQDTSGLQWNNFKPLISDALAEGMEALLVGDVKQSIYRWRNSDWNILANQIASDFPGYPPVEISLDRNWRSRNNIIFFNNATIASLKHTFAENLPGDDDGEYFLRKLDHIYARHVQEPANSARVNEGLTEITFLQEKDFGENSVRLMIEQVKRLQENGLKASDMAILIRKNSEGAVIVRSFMEASQLEENASYNLSVISNESLFLYSSRGVNFVIQVIELLKDSDNRVLKAAMLHLWFSWLKPLIQLGNDLEVSDNDINWLKNEQFEMVFDEELGDEMQQIRKKTLLLSLDETVMEICAQFRLFEIESELPFLQTLTDKAAELKFSLSNDLSGFLLWWNDQGYKTSVCVNEEVDAVRLLTVHKAKGLEFEALFLPFFNWESSWVGNQAPILWCQPSVEPFNRFPLLPVKAGTALAGTIFRDDYFEEKVNSYIDTLNLVYVAFTRAKSVLFVHCKKQKERKDSQSGKTVNALLECALDKLAFDSMFSGCWNPDKSVFAFGKIPKFQPKEISQQSKWITKYHFSGFGNRISLRLNSEGFLVAGEQRPARNSGKLVHEILAGVIRASEIEGAFEKAVAEGMINEDEKTEMVERLKASMKVPVIESWFSGEYKVLNERSLLSAEKIVRPDRIMISGNKAIVVDYKWGEKKQEGYHWQIRQYANLLKKSGFEQVKGYIWYINLGEVEKVMEG